MVDFKEKTEKVLEFKKKSITFNLSSIPNQ